MQKVAVLTSGGDAPGMNAAIRAVVRSCIYYNIEVYGILHGYSGIYSGEFRLLNRFSVADIMQRGGTVLYTARCDEMLAEGGVERACEILKGNGIDYLVVIGGDGSYRGALALSKCGINVITLPATIDNDLACTDYSIGYDTALNTAIEAISRIRDTSSSHNRVNVVEVMGRNCGNLALDAALAGGAEAVAIPEFEYNTAEISKRIVSGKQRGKLHSIVVFAEGAGDIKAFCTDIEKNTQVETRMTVLGYVQRGGSPCALDRILAGRMGALAIELIRKGEKNRAVCYSDGRYTDMDLEDALKMKLDKKKQKEILNTALILAV